MKVKKGSRFRKFRGSKGCGGGFRQKRRGKGNTGGKGMAGTGKRASQKVQFGQIIAREHGFEKYFGKAGFTSASTEKKKKYQMNLADIQKKYKDQKEIVLEQYKILGEGEGFKSTIKAKAASKSAIEKMEKAGGKIVLEKIKEVSEEVDKKNKTNSKNLADSKVKVVKKK